MQRLETDRVYTKMQEQALYARLDAIPVPTYGSEAANPPSAIEAGHMAMYRAARNPSLETRLDHLEMDRMYARMQEDDLCDRLDALRMDSEAGAMAYDEVAAQEVFDYIQEHQDCLANECDGLAADIVAKYPIEGLWTFQNEERPSDLELAGCVRINVPLKLPEGALKDADFSGKGSMLGGPDEPDIEDASEEEEEVIKPTREELQAMSYRSIKALAKRLDIARKFGTKAQFIEDLLTLQEGWDLL